MRLLLATLLISPIAIPAQSKYDLTGKPDATLQESFTQVAGVRELPGNRAIVTDQAERTTCTIRKAHTSAEPHSRALSCRGIRRGSRVRRANRSHR